MRPGSSHHPSFSGKLSTGTIKHQIKEPNKAHLVDFMRKLTEYECSELRHIIGNKIVQLSVF